MHEEEFDDDREMYELVDPNDPSVLREQVAELAEIVADLSKRLAARERQPSFVVFNWLYATESQRRSWVEEVKTWYQRLHEVEPRIADKVPSCWANHREIHWPMCQLYQQWQKAWTHTALDDQGDEFERQVSDPDLGGWWFDKWLGHHRVFMQSIKDKCGPDCQAQNQERALRRVGGASPSVDHIDLDPVPSLPTVGHDNRGRGSGLEL